MSTYVIEIDDKQLMDQMSNIISTALNRQLQGAYSDTNQIVAAACKEVVYSHKDEIIEKVVERATREIVKRGLPKLLERKIDEHTD